MKAHSRRKKIVVYSLRREKKKIDSSSWKIDRSRSIKEVIKSLYMQKIFVHLSVQILNRKMLHHGYVQL